MDAPTTEPIVEQPAAPTPEETSVAAHAASLKPLAETTQSEPTHETQPPPSQGTTQQAKATGTQPSDDKTPARHRAKSQQAGPEDVPRIRELTRRLREAEAEMARLKSSPIQDAGGKSQANAPAEDREPQPEDFESEADPYTAYLRALTRYDLKQQQKGESVKTVEATKAELEEQISQEQASQWTARLTSFAAKTPDFHTVIKPVADIELTPLLRAAIISDDNGPAVAYYLAQHPETFDELLLLTDGKPVSDASVAVLRRRFSNYRQQAVSTGSAARQTPAPLAPPPPNPVRTGPTKTGDDAPGDGHSLAEHSKHYGPKRR